MALKVVFIGKKFVCFFKKQSGSNGKRQLGNNRRLAAQLSRIALDAVGTAYTTAEPRFAVTSLLSALCAPGSRSAAGEARARSRLTRHRSRESFSSKASTSHDRSLTVLSDRHWDQHRLPASAGGIFSRFVTNKALK